MKTVKLECANCRIEFEKNKFEYTRRIKRGATKFFCSLRCNALFHPQKAFVDWVISPEGKAHNKIPRWTSKYPKHISPFAEYVRRAKQKNAKCEITPQYLYDLWQKQHGKCAFSNIPLEHRSASINTMASLDRKNSSIGYIEGNVQFVSCALNYAKNTRPDSSIQELISLIILHKNA